MNAKDLPKIINSGRGAGYDRKEKMMNSYTRKKNKVHVETELVKDIMGMPYCKNAVMVARVLGCHPEYVRLVRNQKKSSAHIYLSEETLIAMEGIK